MSLYYPIGTMVKLSIDKEMLFMISGYLPKQGDGKTGDYLAVPFPLGLIKENQYIIFDRHCITEVVHLGYCDDECQSILDGFDEFVDNMKRSYHEYKHSSGDNVMIDGLTDKQNVE